MRYETRVPFRVPGTRTWLRDAVPPGHRPPVAAAAPLRAGTAGAGVLLRGRGGSDPPSGPEAARPLAARGALYGESWFNCGRSVAAQAASSGMALATAGARTSLAFNYRTRRISPNEMVVPDPWRSCLLFCIFLSSRGGCHGCHVCAHARSRRGTPAAPTFRSVYPHSSPPTQGGSCCCSIEMGIKGQSSRFDL